MEYNYDEESVNALINWAETAQLAQEVTLSEAEHIFDTLSAILSSTIRMLNIIR